MELLILFSIVVIAFQAGKHWGYYKIVKTMKEVAEEQGIDLEKERPAAVHQVISLLALLV
jgi:hypothetical protein